MKPQLKLWPDILRCKTTVDRGPWTVNRGPGTVDLGPCLPAEALAKVGTVDRFINH